MPEDDIEALLRRTLAEHAGDAPSSSRLEQRTLAATRQGPQRHRRPLWTVPVTVAASVLVVVGATAGGVALVHNLSQGSHTPAGVTTTSRTVAIAPSTPPATGAGATASASGSGTGPASATPSVTSTVVGPPTGPLPTGFQLSDLTFVGATHGWGLGTTATCTQKPCTSLVRTTDGGQTWGGIRPPIVGLQGVPADDCDTKACVSNIRFATTSVGYLYGPRVTYITTDGGSHWQKDSGGAQALEIANGNVVRVSTAKPGCTPPGCTYVVETAAIGSSSWRHVTTTSAGDRPELTRSEHNVYLLLHLNPAGGGQSAHSTLYRSGDDGATWTRRGEPCPTAAGVKGEVDAATITSAPGSVTVLCDPRQSDGSAYTASSTDGGAHFTAGAVTAGLGAPIAGGTSVLLAEGEFGTSAAGKLFRSSDGGRHWTVVARTAGSAKTQDGSGFLGFENSTTGRWVSTVDSHLVWTTTDGGRHWSQYVFA